MASTRRLRDIDDHAPEAVAHLAKLNDDDLARCVDVLDEGLCPSAQTAQGNRPMVADIDRRLNWLTPSGAADDLSTKSLPGEQSILEAHRNAWDGRVRREPEIANQFY